MPLTQNIYKKVALVNTPPLHLDEQGYHASKCFSNMIMISIIFSQKLQISKQKLNTVAFTIKWTSERILISFLLHHIYNFWILKLFVDLSDLYFNIFLGMIKLPALVGTLILSLVGNSWYLQVIDSWMEYIQWSAKINKVNSKDYSKIMI